MVQMMHVYMKGAYGNIRAVSKCGYNRDDYDMQLVMLVNLTNIYTLLRLYLTFIHQQ